MIVVVCDTSLLMVLQRKIKGVECMRNGGV